MNVNEKRILKKIAQEPAISIVKLARDLSIGTTTVENNIKKLKEKGLLRRVGRTNSGYWKINEPSESDQLK